MIDQPLSRRGIVLTTGGVLFGGGATALLSDRARAEVTTTDITVPDGDEYASKDGEVYSPWILISGSFTYQTSDTPDGWTLALEVGRDGTNFQPIDTLSGSALGTSMTREYDLAGAVVDHPDWASSDFAAPGDGESVVHQVPLRVVLAVEAADGSVMVGDQDGGVIPLTVTDTGVEASAFISGSASVAWQVKESDSPPA